ncbi:MAG: hypothetical protein ACRDTE_34030 [Pseudonocardiaceae bacterium]
MARHAPRDIDLKKPSCLSICSQATTQCSLLLGKLCWLASHAAVPSYPGFHAPRMPSLALLGAHWLTRYHTRELTRFILIMSQERDVIEHDPHLWMGRLTTVMIRGHTELRVRAHEEMSCVCIEMDCTPCAVLLGVTPTGAENLRTAIDTGLADLASRRQTRTVEASRAGTDGRQGV